MPTHAGPPAEGLLERVRAITPMIAEGSFRAEEQRKPLDEVIEALKDTGVFRSFVPARFGGYEIDLETFIDIGVAVSEACPSTGWITTFYMEHNWLMNTFPEETQEELFGSAPFVLAPGSVNPTGEARPNGDGTYELSGRWQFGTGIMHADWVVLSGRIIRDDADPEQRMFLARVDEVEVKDTWHVDGMVATGSNDIVATALRVPEHHVSLASPPGLRPSADATYLQRLPILPMLSLTAAIPALGCARRALDLFKERIFERVMYGTTKSQSVRIPSQLRLANLITEVRAAETLMRAAAREMQAHANGEAELSMLEQLQLRLTMAHIVHRCRDAVRDIMQASGAKAHFLDSELQRIHRDVHMVSAHTVFDVDLAAEGVGKAIVQARLASSPAPDGG